MLLHLGWQKIVLRLALTALAGLVIGFNRGEHGRPAGMRTTLLVCLAAALAMIQANLLISTVGKSPDSFVNIDVMRLPLGVLSGMGFIGAGAILRKENLVLGVTTAATLWFTTIIGLCFGGGQLGLGITALILGWLTLWGLKYVERSIKVDLRGTLTLSISPQGPTDEDLRSQIAQCQCHIVAWGIRYGESPNDWRHIHCDVERRALPGETHPPAFVPELARSPQIRNLLWQPQGLNAIAPSQQSQPKGTHIAA